MHVSIATHVLYSCDWYNISVFVIGKPTFGCYGYLCDDRTRCVSYIYLCSGYVSCTDGSDEENCCKT